MIYSQCALFGLKTKKVLLYKLGIKNKSWLRQQYVAGFIYPCIDREGKNPRLLEKPMEPLKEIQARMKGMLSNLDFPSYVFSGVKGRSYVDNAKIHAGTNHVYKLDLTAFFPSVAREKVFTFFRDKLCNPTDVAERLTNFTTIDLDLIHYENIDEVNDFLQRKKIKTRKHLISGAPTSQLLSYLVNQDLFERLHELSLANDIVMTVYVDDVVFSSSHMISRQFRLAVKKIIGSQHYRLSAGKVKQYSKLYPKKVTGVIIDHSGGLTLQKSAQVKIMSSTKRLKDDPSDAKERNRLRGLLTSARQIVPGIYPSIHALAYDTKYKIVQTQKRKKTKKRPLRSKLL